MNTMPPHVIFSIVILTNAILQCHLVEYHSSECHSAQPFSTQSHSDQRHSQSVFLPNVILPNVTARRERVALAKVKDLGAANSSQSVRLFLQSFLSVCPQCYKTFWTSKWCCAVTKLERFEQERFD